MRSPSSLFTRFALASVLALGSLSTISGCDTPSATQAAEGSAEVSMQALSEADVATASISISGPALSAPRTQTLFKRNGSWGVSLNGLPAGGGYTFTATAFDANGAAIYTGSVGNVTIVARQSVPVNITANQVDAAGAFKNSAPVIDALSISSTKVIPGDVVNLAVEAHDPDAGDTLTYAWSATGGSFGSTSATQTTWTAPTTEGDYDITLVVQDNRGAKATVKAKVKVDIKNGRGAADVTVTFNNAPTVSSVSATTGWLESGVATMVTATASDPDNNALSYSWSATCAGSFANSAASSTTFTLADGVVAASCTLQVTVSDGTGFATTGEVTLPVGKPAFNEAPEIVSSVQSATAADAGDAVILSVEASDAEGGPVTFTWSGPTGTLSSPSSTPTGSQVTFTAPGTWAPEWTITVVATDQAGNSTQQTFTVKGMGRWMTGDLHQHTYFTDGSFPMNDLTADGVIATSAVTDPSTLFKKGVMPQGFRFGLDVQSNSEHGGVRNRDGFGKAWNSISPNPVVGDGASTTQNNMWRWQSLVSSSYIPGYAGGAYMSAYDWILGIRASYPQKLALTGMEWNPPGHEHSTSGIVSSSPLPIAEFEYRFDKSDADGTSTTTTATTMGWTGKRQNGTYDTDPTVPDYSAVLALNRQHEKTMDAVRWMQANHPTTGWIIPAHVERAGCGVGAWSIAAFRDMNDAGSTVAFGMEGIPGHEKSSNRGELGTGSCGGGSFGGAGKYVAAIGGLWDNLLADGRKFYNYASSDFHNDAGADFWPGEYLKTYVKVLDLNSDGVFSQEEFIAAYRSGNVYSVHGDLVREMEFTASNGVASATMGQTLKVATGSSVTLSIRFKTPATNNCLAGVNASAGYVCKAPSVHHIQLIQGRVNPSKAPKLNADGTPNPAFNAIDNTVASIAQTFDATSWTVGADGFTTMSFTVPNVSNDMFFRIRGSNLGYGVVKTDTAGKTVYGTDAAGSPLINTPGTNNADMAWDDLWFYSNPIFIKKL